MRGVALQSMAQAENLTMVKLQHCQDLSHFRPFFANLTLRKLFLNTSGHLTRCGLRVLLLLFSDEPPKARRDWTLPLNGQGFLLYSIGPEFGRRTGPVKF